LIHPWMMKEKRLVHQELSIRLNLFSTISEG